MHLFFRFQFSKACILLDFSAITSIFLLIRFNVLIENQQISSSKHKTTETLKEFICIDFWPVLSVCSPSNLHEELEIGQRNCFEVYDKAINKDLVTIKIVRRSLLIALSYTSIVETISLTRFPAQLLLGVVYSGRCPACVFVVKPIWISK